MAYSSGKGPCALGGDDVHTCAPDRRVVLRLHVVGERGALDNQVRSATVTALDEVSAIVPARRFAEFLYRHRHATNMLELQIREREEERKWLSFGERPKAERRQLRREVSGHRRKVLRDDHVDTPRKRSRSGGGAVARGRNGRAGRGSDARFLHAIARAIARHLESALIQRVRLSAE
jgi:hypothetical protein